MQFIELAIERASAENLASPSLESGPDTDGLKYVFRDGGFLLFEGRDSYLKYYTGTLRYILMRQ